MQYIMIEEVEIIPWYFDDRLVSNDPSVVYELIEKYENEMDEEGGGYDT